MTPITSDSELVTEVAPAAGAPRRVGRLNGTPEWLLRVSIESVLIVMSILLALGVDEWRENANNRELARQALQIFERELRQNLAQLEADIPYHTGLRDVAVGMLADPESVVEVRSIVEGLTPTILRNTAWETALATGALTRIDVETVSALSLTYSFQQRLREDSRAGRPRLVITDAMTEAQKLTQIQQVVTYLTDMVRAEEELRGFYVQALATIAALSEPEGSARIDTITVAPERMHQAGARL